MALVLRGKEDISSWGRVEQGPGWLKQRERTTASRKQHWLSQPLCTGLSVPRQPGLSCCTGHWPFHPGKRKLSYVQLFIGPLHASGLPQERGRPAPASKSPLPSPHPTPNSLWSQCTHFRQKAVLGKGRELVSHNQPPKECCETGGNNMGQCQQAGSFVRSHSFLPVPGTIKLSPR